MCSPVTLQVRSRIDSAAHREALQLVLDETGFLQDAKAKKLVKSVGTNGNGMASVEAVIYALGVTDGPTFDALMEALRADSSIELRAQGVQAGRLGTGQRI